MLELILILVVAIPVAWLISEWYNNRGARIFLGVCAIGMSFGVAWIARHLDRFQSNVYFADATKDLIQNTIIELEKGRSDVVLTELRTLREEFRPTYETRDKFDELVDRYVHRISQSPVKHEGGDPRWSHEMPDDMNHLTGEMEEQGVPEKASD